MLIAILLLGAIIGSSILILRRIKEERQVLKIELTSGQTLSMATQTLKFKAIQTQTYKTKTLKPTRLVININKADKDELIELPGIGPKLAERILEYRKENGPFTKKEDIIEVKGIGLKKFEKIKDMIIVN